MSVRIRQKDGSVVDILPARVRLTASAVVSDCTEIHLEFSGGSVQECILKMIQSQDFNAKFREFLHGRVGRLILQWY